MLQPLSLLYHVMYDSMGIMHFYILTVLMLNLPKNSDPGSTGDGYRLVTTYNVKQIMQLIIFVILIISVVN